MGHLFRPGDRFYAYCGHCERQTSWVYTDVKGNSRCTEH